MQDGVTLAGARDSGWYRLCLRVKCEIEACEQHGHDRSTRHEGIHVCVTRAVRLVGRSAWLAPAQGHGQINQFLMRGVYKFKFN